MSANETREIVSEDRVAEEQSESLKLVPVAESIRYRKRAQNAEKRAESLREELAEAQSQVSSMAEELSAIRREQELTRKLAGCGVVDLEAGVLLAGAKLRERPDVDIDEVIKQLVREKPYLFVEGNKVGVKKTSGARERVRDRRAALERAGERAATTGSRADLHEYLRLRRNFL